MELVEQRKEVRWLWGHYLVSQGRICGLLGVAELSVRYRSCRSDEALRAFDGRGAGKTALGLPAIADCAGSDGRACESQTHLSRVSGSRADDSAESHETAAAGGIAPPRVDGGEPEVGFGFRAGRGGERAEIVPVLVDCSSSGLAARYATCS